MGASQGPQTSPPGGRSPVDRALTGLTDEARRSEARTARQQRSDREILDGLSATFLGTLVDACEARALVVVVTAGGAHHRGLITAVGPDVVVMTLAGEDQRLLVAPMAIDAVREAGGVRSRSVADVGDGPRFADVLESFAGAGARLAVKTMGGNLFMGRLLQLGADQLTLTLDGDGHSLTVPLLSVAEVVIEP